MRGKENKKERRKKRKTLNLSQFEDLKSSLYVE